MTSPTKTLSSGRQVRFFATNDRNNLWSDGMIVNVLRPIIDSAKLDWFWFTRYHTENEFDPNDCEWSKIPRAYKKVHQDGSYTCRSMRFRFCTKDKNVEQELKTLLETNEYWYSDIRDYDYLQDLGSMTMVKCCEWACRVVLENLDELGKIPSYAAFRNLEQMHHRICNIAHLTDYRKLGKDLVKQVLSDWDNVRYDSQSRTWPL